MISSKLSQVINQQHFFKPQNSPNLATPFGSKGQYHLEVAETKANKIKAYSLIYHEYFKKGYVAAHHSKMWYSKYDALPSTYTIVAKEGHDVVGCLTVVKDSQMSLPANDIYQSELSPLQKSHQISEIISLGLDSSRKTESVVLAKILDLSYIIAKEVHFSNGFIITVNPRHQFFYKRKLLFKKIGHEKSFKKVQQAPAVLLHIDFKTIKDEMKDLKTKTIYKTLIGVPLKENALRFKKMKCANIQELDFFFQQQRDFFKSMSKAEIALIENKTGLVLKSNSIAKRLQFLRSLASQNRDTPFFKPLEINK